MFNTFKANLKHAIRNKESVSIGGGIFDTKELKEILECLNATTKVWNADGYEALCQQIETLQNEVTRLKGLNNHVK